MKYALLIYAAERDWAAKSPDVEKRIYDECSNYAVELKKSGKMPSAASTSSTQRLNEVVP